VTTNLDPELLSEFSAITLVLFTFLILPLMAVGFELDKRFAKGQGSCQ